MKLPLLSGKKVFTALQRLGFAEIHRKGSHVKMGHPDGRRIVFRSTTKWIGSPAKARYETQTLTERSS